MGAFFSGSQSVFSWSALSGMAIALSVLAIAIWWIVRKRLRDFWMPIVRVLDLPVSRLPRIVVKRPPMVPFIAFALAALAFSLWTERPSLRVFSDFEPGVSQIHVYVDMSPSVSARVSLNDLGARLVSVLEQVGPKSKVTFGTSHGDDVYELTTVSGAADLITGLGFHRGGSKIGSGIRAQVARIGEIDQLFVISDRDQHSWGGFQWQYLLVDADVRFVDVDESGSRAGKSNVFIQDARFLSATGALTMDWDIEISEGAWVSEMSGTLNASIAGESLVTTNWEIPAGRRSTTVSVSWPSTKIPDDVSHEAIEWTIEVAGGDAMLLDNKFRTPVIGRRERVAVIGEPTGELRLEDFLMPLETALQVSGYDVARFDRLAAPGAGRMPARFKGTQMIMALAGDEQSLDQWCPVKSGDLDDASQVPVWLMPRIVGESFRPMCLCVAGFGVGVTSDMCDANLSRDGWIATLSGVGARQIGGDVGSARQAIAMRLMGLGQGSGARVDVTMFTIPLRPDAKLGLSWGGFPILVRQLTEFSSGRSPGPDEGSRGSRNLWQSVTDITQVPRDESGQEGMRTRILRETNVPAGESMLAVLPVSDLPPAWSAGGGLGRGHVPSKRDSEDALPWVRALAAVVVLSLIAEVIWILRRARMRKLAGLALLCGASMWGFAPDAAMAQIRIEWMAGRDSPGVSYETLAREVSSRTTIELGTKPDFFTVFDDAAAERPWIWTTAPSRLAGKNGGMSSGGRLWLKRGGILIIDGSQTDGSLEKLFEPMMTSTVRPSGWMAMPPDHEFMRSFYLLNSLPTCKGRGWRIFSFDGRVAAIVTPYSLLSALQDQPAKWTCDGQVTYEQQVRIFVNLMMMALTTDYKRDQVHLPEILKRLRIPQ